MQYFPLFSGAQNNGTLVIRSSGDVQQFALRCSDWSRNWIITSVSDVLTMEQLLGKSTLDASFNATLLLALRCCLCCWRVGCLECSLTSWRSAPAKSESASRSARSVNSIAQCAVRRMLRAPRPGFWLDR